jgi:hypothetical protein
MEPFDYTASKELIRPEIAPAYRRAWKHLASPGSWLTGAERVAVADETRRAQDCRLCRDRKAALSPYSVEGEHDHGGVLSKELVDEVHRVTTDAARLTETWYRSLLGRGLAPEAYVEALGVTVIVISIDQFHRALGLVLQELPKPLAGEPDRKRPDGIVEGEAWVPMQDAKTVAKREGLPGGSAPYVIRALSLVPAEVEMWSSLSEVQYLGRKEMMSFDQVRSIDRSQIELVAGRVSAVNECFY